MKKLCYIVFFSLLTVGSGIWIYYNINNNENFFIAPLYSIITIIIALVFTFFLNQVLIEKRRKKENLLRIVQKTIVELDSPCLIIKNESDVLSTRLLQQSIRNHIKMMTGNKLFSQQNKTLLSLVEKDFNDYWDFLSEHINDVEYLIKSQSTLSKHIQNAKNKLDEISLNID